MDETIGGRYRLERKLGAGAMAEVWLATDTQLGRLVALKRLRADADPVRFEREAHAVASLSHPNIARLFDYGSEEGRPYMVFEHLPGGTLEDRLATGEPLDDSEAQTIATEIAAGLAHAHERGLVHRDLKPTNIVFDEEGRARITDFGIARMSGADTLTEAGTLVGTAAYMSPEQASGGTITPASDVYSFGVIVFRMLTGRLPFESSNAVDLVRRQLYEAPPPITAIRPDSPQELAAVAEESLAKEPGERPPDGRALVALLAGAAAPTPGGAATQVVHLRGIPAAGVVAGQGLKGAGGDDRVGDGLTDHFGAHTEQAGEDDGADQEFHRVTGLPGRCCRPSARRRRTAGSRRAARRRTRP